MISTLNNHAMSPAAICRANGWGVGTKLVGNEGYGDTVIEITAIGGSSILARALSHRGDTRKCSSEANWTLGCRDWRPFTPLHAETVENPDG